VKSCHGPDQPEAAGPLSSGPMKAVVEPLEGNRVKLSVEVDESEFEKAVDAAFRKLARQVRVPGFRPGKTPRRLLEARLGAETLRQEALRDSLPDFYAQALREADVDPIAPPEIDITAGQEQGPVTFDAVVEIRPQLSVAGYQGLRVTIPSPLMSEEEVDNQIDKLREQFGELQPVARPARDRDHVTIDVHSERHGEPVAGLSAEDYLYEVGSGAMVADLDERLHGAKVGDIFHFSANVDDGDPVSFRVLVKEVKEKVLPEVTDEWASEASEFETVEELRADIAKRGGIVKRMQANLALRDEAIRALVELVDVDLPESLINEEMERRSSDLVQQLKAKGMTLPQYLDAIDISEEDLVAAIRDDAVRSVKADLTLRAVAEAENLLATDEDVDAEVTRLAQRLGENPARVRQTLEQRDAIPTVRSDVRKAKALEWLVEHVEVVDEEGRVVDRADLSTSAEATTEAVSTEAKEGESLE
jgi:trigger factor